MLGCFFQWLFSGLPRCCPDFVLRPGILNQKRTKVVYELGVMGC